MQSQLYPSAPGAKDTGWLLVSYLLGGGDGAVGTVSIWLCLEQSPNLFSSVINTPDGSLRNLLSLTMAMPDLGGEGCKARFLKSLDTSQIWGRGRKGRKGGSFSITLQVLC